MSLVLLLFGLLCTAAGLPGPVGLSEGLPENLIEEYFDSVASSAKESFVNVIPIDDLDWGLDNIYGLPFKLKISTKGGILRKPGDMKRVSEVTGFQELSGTAHIKGFLYLGQVTVEYDTLSVNIFGLELTGKASATIFSTVTPVSINVYQNAVTKRKTEATIGELRGLLAIRLGSGNSYFLTAFNYLLDVLFSLRYIKDVFLWAFFENITAPIETALSTAAKTIML